MKKTLWKTRLAPRLPSPWISKPPEKDTLIFGGGKKFTKNYTVLILDSSGSMESLKGDIVGSFNEQIKAIKKSPVETIVSFVTFSDQPHQPVFWGKKASELEEISNQQYTPIGMTALNDTLGKVISELRTLPDINNDDVSVLLLVFTDGYENNSKEYTTENLKNGIEELQRTGKWTISYIGSQVDPLSIQRDYGIKDGNIMSYVHNSCGVRRMTSQVSNSLDGYYSSQVTGNIGKSFFGNTGVNQDNKNSSTEDTEATVK